MGTPRSRMAARICRTKAAGGRHQRGKLWSAMRMLRRFTPAELVAVVEARSADSVAQFARLLWRAGFLRKHQANARSEVTYQLVRDSGPHAPSITRRGTAVHDHNTDTEYSLDAQP